MTDEWESKRALYPQHEEFIVGTRTQYRPKKRFVNWLFGENDPWMKRYPPIFWFTTGLLVFVIVLTLGLVILASNWSGE